jgi:hypothetical protein
MNLQINKAVLLAGVLSLSMLSCSTDSEGEVKSISESFENPTTEVEVDPTIGKFLPLINVTNNNVTVKSLFEGGEAFMWSFPGATPDSSSDAKPGSIEYPGPGEYTITLDVTVADEDYTHSETITIE